MRIRESHKYLKPYPATFLFACSASSEQANKHQVSYLHSSALHTQANPQKQQERSPIRPSLVWPHSLRDALFSNEARRRRRRTICMSNEPGDLPPTFSSSRSQTANTWVLSRVSLSGISTAHSAAITTFASGSTQSHIIGFNSFNSLKPDIKKKNVF